ncbi:efflux RND transporter periplasmic adaptor subunit [Novosphingobium sp. MBES04]|uniref:efflux RND transporter periplasmic adaptor subunit n=1 Tax=Novosphingobium sp. MBES04 TaxID=1206458 RepID=UPI000AC8FAD3|nr:efflux RND transporter periplasmic adaptor subunit [Novosphingobium sp. MBES04]
MFKSRRTLIVGAVIGVLVLPFLVWQVFLSPPEGPDVVTAKVARGDLEKTVEATGSLMPKDLVSVGAQASGRIEQLTVEVGDTVKQGELIAQIDSRTQENTLKTAQADVANMTAQLASAQASLAQSRLAFERQKQLGVGEATSQADYQAAEAEYRSAKASVDALNAQIDSARVSVENAQVNLGYTKVTAPMDGVVVAIVNKQGTTVNANQSTPSIVVLAKLDVMTVETEVSEADVINVKQGQSAYFTILGDPDTRYSGMLRLVEPAPESIVDEVGSSSSSSSSSTSDSAIYYNALFDVSNADNRLRALMTAKVTILLDQRKDVLTIPSSALGVQNKDGTYSVQVQDVQRGISRRNVKIGLNNNVSAEVLSGLKEGEAVVVSEASAESASSGRRMGGPPPF